LDAHKVLSQFSSVRLDNFIYTRESFAEIKKHLNPDGVLSLTYLLFKDWLGARLYATLREVFGDDILVFRTSTYGAYDDTVIFLAGPGIKKAGLVNDPKVKRFDGYATHRGFITDDWPYLYVTQRNIPAHYLVIILAIAAISFAGVFLANFPSLPKFDMHFFFLGAGFMLLETVSITRCALLFGSTWVVNSVVIVSILSMALIATFYAEKIKRIRIKVIYLLLAVSLLWNWLVGPGSYLAFSKALGTILSSVACALPVLFSSIIFAGSFKRSKNVPVVFACNLLGAMGGGCLEYLSMLTGFRALYLLVILIYCLSYIGLVLKREVSFFP
jgi:hypothetical protein